MFCHNCGANVPDNSASCPNCGTMFAQPTQQPQQTAYAQPVYAGQQKSKLVAGLLGILLGGLGIHNFYLGNTGRAVLQLVLSLCSCGIASLWGFIEGILILVGNINTDANGVPLAD